MFKDISIKARLIGVIGMLSVVLIGVGTLGLVGMQKANEGLLSVYQDRTLPTMQIASIRNRLMQNRLAIAVSLVTPTAEEIRRNTEVVDKNIGEITSIWEKYYAGVRNAEEKKAADKFADDRKKFVGEGLKPAVAALRANNVREANRIVVEAIRPYFVPVGEGIDKLMTLQGDLAKQEYDEANARFSTFRNLAVAAIAIGVLLAGVLGFFLIRAIVRPLTAAIGHFEEIGKGNYKNHIEVHANDEAGKVLSSLKDMQQKLDADITAAKLLADESARIKRALDAASTNVMMADVEGKIIYTNQAVQSMLRTGEADIRKDLPAFRADSVLGANFDSFHKNVSHQRNLLKNLSSTYRTSIVIGGRSYNLVANPVLNEAGERLGTSVEWHDRTLEVAVEKEVSGIVSAAAQGDFTQRVKVEGKDGFFKILAESMNKLLETSATGLNEVVRVLGALAKGDLTEKITNEYAGTFGQLKDDSNRTVTQLNEIITQIKETSQAIDVSTKEIAQGNTDLSSRTEEQASSLEETASSMEELTSTVKQNAENAKQANQLAAGASDIAVKGGQVVGQVVETMTAISDSSKKIVDIISVIDGIAFQTNILALNAAVEAARAGEQGRGFAVVASEVRNLAQRSAAAAKEIKELITNSVEKVEDGTKLVDTAGQTMEEIVQAVKRVTDIMGEISAASMEQSTGIEQVNQAITQMDQVTQQNAALVEEVAATAESLQEQAQGLIAAVAVFRMEQGAQAAAGGPRTAAKRPSNVTPMPAPAAKKPEATSAKPASRLAPKAVKVSGGDDEWKEF